MTYMLPVIGRESARSVSNGSSLDVTWSCYLLTARDWQLTSRPIGPIHLFIIHNDREWRLQFLWHSHIRQTFHWDLRESWPHPTRIPPVSLWSSCLAVHSVKGVIFVHVEFIKVIAFFDECSTGSSGFCWIHDRWLFGVYRVPAWTVWTKTVYQLCMSLSSTVMLMLSKFSWTKEQTWTFEVRPMATQRCMRLFCSDQICLMSLMCFSRTYYTPLSLLLIDAFLL